MSPQINKNLQPGFYILPSQKADGSSLPPPEEITFFMLTYKIMGTGYYEPRRDFLALVKSYLFGSPHDAAKCKRHFSNGMFNLSIRYLTGLENFHIEATGERGTFKEVTVPFSRFFPANDLASESPALYTQNLETVGLTLKENCRLLQVGENSQESCYLGDVLALRPDAFHLPFSLVKLFADHLMLVLKFAAAKNDSQTLQLTKKSILEQAYGYRTPLDSAQMVEAFTHCLSPAWNHTVSDSCAGMVIKAIFFTAEKFAVILRGMLNELKESPMAATVAKSFLQEHYQTLDVVQLENNINTFISDAQDFVNAINRNQLVKDLWAYLETDPASPFKFIAAWRVVQKNEPKRMCAEYADPKHLNQCPSPRDLSIENLYQHYKESLNPFFIPRTPTCHSLPIMHALKLAMLCSFVYRLIRKRYMPQQLTRTNFILDFCIFALSSAGAHIGSRVIGVVPPHARGLTHFFNSALMLDIYRSVLVKPNFRS